jgi:hypothetical protein
MIVGPYNHPTLSKYEHAAMAIVAAIPHLESAFADLQREHDALAGEWLALDGQPEQADIGRRLDRLEDHIDRIKGVLAAARFI